MKPPNEREKPATTLSPAEFQARTGVSGETLARLERYAALLLKWNAAINLVSVRSLSDLWRRHMLDSAQLFPLLPPLQGQRPRVVVDLGSGAGFPGLVLAILGAGEVHLFEADQRKAAFLREAARETETSVTIHAERIEVAAAFPADAVTARALAPLPVLIGYAESFLRPAPGKPQSPGIALFLKGKGVQQELTDSMQKWEIAAESIPSVSDRGGSIIRLRLLT